jgi:hypothetical protein
MIPVLRYALFAGLLIYFGILTFFAKRGALNLKYLLVWFISGIIMLALLIWPHALKTFSSILGIYDDTNALFAVVCFCIIILLMSLTAIASRLNAKATALAQANALLEKRLFDIEEQLANSMKNGENLI